MLGVDNSGLVTCFTNVARSTVLHYHHLPPIPAAGTATIATVVAACMQRTYVSTYLTHPYTLVCSSGSGPYSILYTP